MELGELVGRLGSAILGVDDFQALLQEATELIATAAGAEFVSIQLEQSGSRYEYRWDRHGLVPASFAPRPAARTTAAGHRSEVLTAGMSEVGLRCAVMVPVWAFLWNTESLLLLSGQQPDIAAGAAIFSRAYMWSILPFIGFLVMRNFVAALEKPISEKITLATIRPMVTG